MCINDNQWLTILSTFCLLCSLPFLHFLLNSYLPSSHSQVMIKPHSALNTDSNCSTTCKNNFVSPFKIQTTAMILFMHQYLSEQLQQWVVMFMKGQEQVKKVHVYSNNIFLLSKYKVRTTGNCQMIGLKLILVAI